MREIGSIYHRNLLKALTEDFSFSLPFKAQIQKEDLVYKNDNWLQIFETEVNFKLNTEYKNTYSRIKRPDFSQIILSNDSGKYLFQLRYRIGCKDYIIELPGGAIERDETPINGAKRELKEEIGLEIINLKTIGSCYMDPMRSNYKGYFFKASLEHSIASFKDYVDGDLEESIFFWMNKNEIIKYSSLIASSSLTALTFNNFFISNIEV